MVPLWAFHISPVIQCSEKSERQPRVGPGITCFGSLRERGEARQVCYNVHGLIRSLLSLA